MFTHIAMFKWKQGAAKAEIETALKKIEDLAKRIPGIIEISTGENQSEYASGYTHVVLVRADSKEAIEAYRVHSEHQQAASMLEIMEEHGIGVDFETK